MLDPTVPPGGLKTALDGVGPLLPLELRRLTYDASGKRVIDSLDLTVEERGITAIMGPNGAGKSVLLRLMHGLIAPTSGEILWAGQRLDRELARRQAMVFQKPVLLRRSAAGNIWHALGLRGIDRGERAIRVDGALKAAGLERLASMPARVLSGGEQQRLCLARALSLEPDVLFLDEPTASLDPASTLAIEGLLIDAQHRGIKVVVVTHDVGQARRLAQDVVFLHHGRVTEHDAAKSFFAHPQSEAARAFLAGGLVL
ncbi:MAG: phosphate ABC transporter ATP-binding protein [Methyloceanibacter sp.]